ncbi:IS30 family transposase [Anaerocellum danielii]|uniref:IS30 family transposase n=1 Tax=Anaerocellum danielii TaxID=1387557 RepID=A0ABZ0U2Z4_9FIRM|nr:IS30 family transposase [Caldicellulosiruptor danielii]WPX08968.1 IS30 family transposase [Caldicellulosiruptor danielii]WPX09139.1 IS30 family transposase [Caldicellulosiruptor danielii]
MAYDNHSTKRRKFKHLSEVERGIIQKLLELGYGIREIARELGRSASTISREVKRGTTTQMKTDLSTFEKYFAQTGQAVYEKNRAKCGRKSKLLGVENFLKFAEEKILKDKWSPDAVVGYCRQELGFSKDEMVCTKTLYNWIEGGLLRVKNIDLPVKVRLKPRKIKYRVAKIKSRGKSIEERPEVANNREEFGHWEIDTLVGKRSSDNVLVTLTERKTRFGMIFVIPGRESSYVKDLFIKLQKILGDKFNKVFKSVTSDNGSEFSELGKVLNELGSEGYYTHPYSAYERGTNERMNGLIRRFLPKGKEIREISKEAIKRIQEWYNRLPRRIFNYKSSIERFLVEMKEICEIGVIEKFLVEV